jgi:uncharacterized repeat protein (TIGR01451 family)
MQFIRAKRVALSVLFGACLSGTTLAAITGRVFQDYNGNGQFDTTGTASATASDRGVGGVTLTAYGLGNTSCGTATSASTGTAAVIGTYSLTLTSTTVNCAGPTYRIEFTNLPATYFPSARSTDSVANGVANGSGSTVQFAADGATDVNLAINVPCDYCENNPALATSRHVGSGLDNITAALSFPFSAGIPTSTTPNGTAEFVPTTHGLEINSQSIGAVWGSSFARQKRTLFYAAFQKRHAAYAKTAADTQGLNGSGRIYYVAKPSAGAGPVTVTTPNLLVDLEALFPGSTKPAGNLHDPASSWDNDNVAFGLVGRVGFGDVAVSRDESLLYVVSLRDKRIYRVPLSAPVAQVTTAASISSVDILGLASVPVATCTAANLIPGAINVNRYTGQIFFGLTCVAAGTGGINDPSAMRAFVYRWDGTAASATQVANFPLNYARQCASSDTGGLTTCSTTGTTSTNSDGEWLPWSDNQADLRSSSSTGGTVYSQALRPQPWLMNIDFDEANNMILGLVDRAGHQLGNVQGGASVGVVEGVAAGDTLRLPASTTIPGAGTWSPPAAVDFYAGDSYGNAHGEITIGGLVYVPGTSKVVSTAFDPVEPFNSNFRSGGIVWLDNATGAKSQQYMVFGTDAAGSFGKAAGMGDIELLCDPAPIELGNRVWNDLNANGIQDPNETGIANVTVRLYASNGTTLLATAVTDANGEYYFTSGSAADANPGDNIGIVNGQITPNTAYQIKVDLAANYAAGGSLNGLGLTTANQPQPSNGNAADTSNSPVTDAADSDAIVATPGAMPSAANPPTIAVTTGEAGSNNHGLDIGFVPLYSLGNRVWRDTDRSGTINGVEAGVNGVSVSVFADANGDGVPDGAALATVVTASGGYYRFDGLRAGGYVVRVNASNFATGGALANTLSSATTETNPNLDVDSNDNGLNPANFAAHQANGVLSGTVTLGGTVVGSEPTTDTNEPGTYGAGSTTALSTGAPVFSGASNQSNLSVDFGFVDMIDLSIGKTVSPAGPYVPGQSVTYTVTATNNGPGNALAGYTVTDLIPANLTVTARTNAGFTCTQGTSFTGAATDVCTAAAGLNNGASATITYTATIGNAVGTSVKNVAYVTPAPTDVEERIPLGTPPTLTTNTGTSPTNNDGEATVAVQGFSIGNRVWLDNGAGTGGVAGDGIQNGTEAGISGVQIRLLDSGGNQIGTTQTTDTSGYYRFDNVPPGTYTVEVVGSTLPAGLVNSPNVAGDRGDKGTPSGANFTAPVTVGAGLQPTGEPDITASGAGAQGPVGDANTNSTIDFGFVDRIDLSVAKVVTSSGPYLPGSTVTYAVTARNNGPAAARAEIVVRDQLPAGLTAVSALGTNWSCTPQTGAAVEIACTRATAAGALASATNADVITVTATVNAGVASGTSLTNLAQVNPAAGEPRSESNPLGTGNGGYETGDPTVGSNNDAGAAITVAAATFSIGDLVWNDTNNNGIRDTGETPLSGATVALFAATGGNPTGAALGTVTTDATGRYRFDGLVAGDYVVVVTPPAGYVSSTGTGSGSTATNELDNGQDTRIAAGNPGAGGFRSGVITVGPGNNAPTGESNNGAAVPGSGVFGAGGESPDNRSNRTVDFGFYQPFDLTIAKAVTSSGPYIPGATVTYTLTARNLGPGSAGAAIVVKDRLPAGLTAVSALGTNWSCTPQTGAAVEITCTRTATAALAASAAADVITVTATVDTGVANGSALNNLAQVNPSAADVAAGKTEVNPLGTGNGGYETGDPAVGSNNDAGATITSSAVPRYALGNRVWFDTNNDGQINTGELGGAGIKVELINPATSAVLATTVTDVNGYYLFDNLDAGNYQVRIPQDNWTGITAAAGVPAAAVGTTPLAGYGNSTGATNAAASFAAADNNRDHGTDSATPATTGGISSATIALGAATVGTGDTTEVATGAAPTSTVGDANDNQTIDFGFYKLAVGNTVWSDTGTGAGGVANDGIRNGTEAGIDGVTVELYEETTPGSGSFVLVATATTAGGGQYMFMQKTDGNPLRPGVNYQVRIPGGQAPLAGLQSSADPGSAGTPLGADNDDQGTGTSPATGVTSTASFQLTPFAAGAGTNGTTSTNADGKTDQPRVDLGFSGVPPVTYALGNRIWFDTNNDGQLGAGESGIDGVVVQLVDGASGNPIAGVPTQITAGGGYYLFDSLPAGSYAVRVLPSNWAGAGVLAGHQSSTPTSATYAAGDNNRDHGVNPVTAAAYVTSGVTSSAINLGAATVLTGEDAGSPNSAVGDANDNRTADFGFYKLSVGNLLFNDSGAGGGVANDGIRNGTEPGIAGVTVQLVDAGGNVVAQTVTDANGGYTFTQGTSVPAVGTAGVPNGQPLLPGAYTVRIPANQPPLTGFNSSADPAGGGQPVGDGRDNAPGVTPSTTVINSSPITLQADGTLPAGATPNNANGTTDQPRVDFGFNSPAPTFSIGNRVFRDNGTGGGTPSDGIQNGTEPGIANITVRLLDSGGNVVQTVTTDTNGYYRFDNVPAGTYTIEVVGSTLPTGFTSSPSTQPNDRGDKGLDTPVAGNFRSTPVTVGTGLQPTGEADVVATGTGFNAQGPGGDAATNSTIDFGFVPPSTTYSVGNRVFTDTNNNGVFDAGDVGLDGVTVRLLDSAGNPVTGVPAQTTTGGGYYLFTNVPSGTYIVEIVPPAGTASSSGSPNLSTGPFEPGSADYSAAGNNRDHGTRQPGGTIRSQPISLTGSQPTGEGTDLPASITNPAPDDRTLSTVDFGLTPVATLGNLVFNDSNRNGRADVGEPGVSGVVVTVKTAGPDGVVGTPDDVVAGTTTTDPNGNWTILVPPGTYYAEFTYPPGLSNTVPGSPGVDNTNQVASGNRTGLFSVGPGGTNLGLDAGVTGTAETSREIPTLRDWMLVLLSMLLAAAAIGCARREGKTLK